MNNNQNRKIYRKVIITFALLIIEMVVYGQFYTNLGYNASFTTNLSNLNFVVDRYNETRPYLDKTMGHFHYFDGLTFNVGAIFTPVFVEVGYTGGTQVQEATGTDNSGTEVTRQLQARMRTFDICFGLSSGVIDAGIFSIGFGMNVGSFALRTRVGEDHLRKIDWGDPINYWDKTLFTYSLFVRYTPNHIPISIQPFINIMPKKLFGVDMTSNMYEPNEYLNPYTYQSDPSELTVTYTNFGIKLCVFLNIPFE